MSERRGGPRLARIVELTTLGQPHSELGSRVEPEFLEDVAHVGLHGAFGDGEFGGDLVVSGKPSGDEIDDLPLAAGERVL